MAGIRLQSLGFLANGAKPGNRKFSQRIFQFGKLPPAELGQNLVHRTPGQRRVNPRQVISLRPPLEAGAFRWQAIRIRLGLADFPGNGVGVISQIKPRQVGRVRLRHFLGSVPERHHPCGGPYDKRLRLREEITLMACLANGVGEIQIEFPRDVPRQFQMLFLVLADRHMGCLVSQDVGRHQIGIDIEPDGSLFLVLAGLFLELGHPVQPAHARHAIEYPGKLRVLGNLALVENNGARGIEPAGQIGGGDVEDGLVQLFRVLPDSDGVHVDHAINAFVGFLQFDPVQHGAQIIAEVQIARRLHAGKNPGGE